MKVNAWRVPGYDPSLFKTVDLLHLGLNSCSCVTDECLLKLFVSSGRERSGGLCRRRKGVADHGMSALSHGCGQLQNITVAVIR